MAVAASPADLDRLALPAGVTIRNTFIHMDRNDMENGVLRRTSSEGSLNVEQGVEISALSNGKECMKMRTDSDGLSDVSTQEDASQDNDAVETDGSRVWDEAGQQNDATDSEVSGSPNEQGNDTEDEALHMTVHNTFISIKVADAPGLRRIQTSPGSLSLETSTADAAWRKVVRDCIRDLEGNRDLGYVGSEHELQLSIVHGLINGSPCP
jgi:hypothetical protein